MTYIFPDFVACLLRSLTNGVGTAENGLAIRISPVGCSTSMCASLHTAEASANDPWCGFIRDVLARRGREPIRLCRLGSCGRFFIRDRKRAFCSPGCKLKFHEPARRWSRPKRRDYQYRYLAKKLLAAGGTPAIKSRIKRVERGKISAEKKQRRLAILRAVLRRQRRY